MINKYTYHGKIGGTYACVIAKGDHFGTTPADIWAVLTGKEKPVDLTDKLPVQIGIATEDVNVRFFEKRSKLTVDRSERTLGVWEHPEHDFAVCQPDGLVGKDSLFEAKHTSSRGDMMKMAYETYYPQLQHNMAVTNMQRCYFSVIFDNNRIEYEVINRDDEYINTLMEREAAFWEMVKMDLPPEGYVDPLAPKKPPFKEVDMTGNNEWANHVFNYREFEYGAKAFAEAKEGLKEMAPKDARITSGHGLTVSRAKNGAARLKVE